MKSADEKTNTLYDAITAVVDARLARVHVGMWARVLECDGRKCKVQPIVRGLFSDGEAVKMPPITDVPIRWPMAGQYMVVFPVVKGDIVWLTFGEYSQEEWLNTGGDDVTPNLPRRFDLADAVAEPGGRSFAKDFDFDNDKMIIGLENGLRLEVSDDQITVGGKDGGGAQIVVTKGDKISLTAGGVAGGELLDLVIQLLTALETSPSISVQVGLPPPAPEPNIGVFNGVVLPLLSAIKIKLTAMKA